MKLLDWLQIIFVAAKILGFINWSWWVVLLPIEIVFACLILDAIFN